MKIRKSSNIFFYDRNKYFFILNIYIYRKLLIAKN